MRTGKSLLILVVLAAVAVAAVVMLQRGERPAAPSASLLYPELMPAINDVAAVEVQTAEERFTVVREGGRWVVPEKAGYPADADVVRRFVIGAAELRVLEPKTANPELHAELGLEDVDSDGAKSARVVLRDGEQRVLADLIVGKSRPGKADPDQRELYVRRSGETQTWLVEGDAEVQRRAVAWLEQDILDLERARIRRAEVDHADGDDVVVERDNPRQSDFVLLAVPDGKMVQYQFSVNEIATSFTTLRFDDVAPATDVDFSAQRVATATLDTFDGLRVRMELVPRDGQRYVRLTAEFDAERAQHAGAGAAAGSADAASETAVGEGAAAAPAESAAQATEPMSADEVREEVDRLNAAWAGWAYRLPDFRVDNIFKPMAELVADPEQAEAPAVETPPAGAERGDGGDGGS